MRRARGCGGRFLDTKKAKKTDDDGAAKADAPALSFNSLISNGSGNTNSPSSIQGATPESKMSPSTKGICQKKPESQFSYHLKPDEKGEDEDHRLRKLHTGIMMSQSPNWAVTIQWQQWSLKKGVVYNPDARRQFILGLVWFGVACFFVSTSFLLCVRKEGSFSFGILHTLKKWWESWPFFSSP